MDPADPSWIDATLAQPEAEGVTWAVFRDGTFVTVVETVFDSEAPGRAYIPAIAVRPDLRGQGLGRAVLQALLARHASQGLVEHIVFIAQDNDSGRRLAEAAGFIRTSDSPNEHGYLTYRRGDVPP
jgi:ribosomal protein S18 acetylase RimI-like enzyme